MEAVVVTLRLGEIRHAYKMLAGKPKQTDLGVDRKIISR
jgi:hypothetical protein